MKFKCISILIISSFLTLVGCKSTPESNIVKYESRCGEVELNRTGGVVLKRVEPKYPVSAARKGKQGYVKMEFDISESGKPININIIETSTGKIFNKSAITALKQWRYKSPKTCVMERLSYYIG